ncbi:uncharacterized protein LOC130591779 [Beta vulgaris subsp. vulgaris]|uniref:uncharacterized protein LOC130591779 n=1 Tax=Beta vulgaris subsp. vulgaris TaxID=3555 RepID=UPI002548D998|nr:uncharacterized protein LOC130591779 [Beta vulgaris subsp. vulgaris]
MASNRPVTSAPSTTVPRRSAGTANAAYVQRGPEKKNLGNLNHLKQADVDNNQGASHSFISETFIERLNLKNVTPCEADIFIPSGLSVTCNRMYLDVPIAYGETTLSADLIAFPLKDFDVILGMDCRRPVKIISALTLKSYLRKGCPMYLCHIHDTSKERPELIDVPIVNEYQDVFPNDILNMPPKRDVEFNIDLVPGTGPISKPPYRMAPAEMRELKTQLEELLDKGYIRPSVSPWGAPVLREKEGWYPTIMH